MQVATEKGFGFLLIPPTKKLPSNSHHDAQTSLWFCMAYLSYLWIFFKQGTESCLTTFLR